MKLTRPSGSEVKQARQAAGLTQQQAADLVHTESRNWQNWEYDAARMPAATWELFQIKVKALGENA